MSSINPLLLLPQALNNRATELASGFVASLSLGAGQFCTNPGLVIAVAGEALTRFEAQAAETLADTAPQTMLTAAIHAAYDEGCARWMKNARSELLSQGPPSAGGQCRARLFATSAASFLKEPELAEERFGPASLIVRCQSTAELVSVVRSLEGQLTITLQLEPADYAFARQLIPVLETRAGRILCNGYPTGVEVCNAMIHGGPFPSTSDGRCTSVGAAAIERFLRPVCYQDMPDELLPEALQSVNVSGIPRHENSYG
jgi:NADP-dependent aldehyde dehydrogenase